MAFFGFLGSLFGVVGLFVGVAVGVTPGLGSIHHRNDDEQGDRDT